jgi:hypothetical protein
MSKKNLNKEMSTNKEKLNKIFNTEIGILPLFSDYIDDKGNLLINFKYKKAPYVMQKGVRYELYIVHPKNENIEKRGLYGKLENVRSMYPIPQTFTNKEDDKRISRTCKVQFELNKKHAVFKVLKELRIYTIRFCTKQILSVKNQELVSNRKKGDFVRIMREKIIAGKLDGWDKIKDCKNEDLVKFVDKIDYRDLLSSFPVNYPLSKKLEDEMSYLQEISKNTNIYEIGSIKIPMTKYNEKWESTKKIDPNNPKIRISKRFKKKGIQFCNFELKKNYIKARNKLKKYEKRENPNQDILKRLETEFRIAKKDYDDSENIQWTFNNINKYIPEGTLFKYFGFTLSSVYVSPMMWVISAEGKHAWYTNDVENHDAQPDDPSDYIDDESDDDDANVFNE